MQRRKAEFALYKEQLRPLIRDAISVPCAPRPDGVHWDGMEYFDPIRRTGVLFAFRGSTVSEREHTFQLQGVSAERKYRLHYVDASAPDQTVSGAKLLEGLAVALPAPLSSEIIFLEEAR